MASGDSARKLAALVTIAGVVGASHWLQPVRPRPDAGPLTARAVVALPSAAPVVVRVSMAEESPFEAPASPVLRQISEPLPRSPVVAAIRSEDVPALVRPSAVTEPHTFRAGEPPVPVPSLLAAVLRVDIGLAPSVEVAPLATDDRWPLLQVFSVAGRSVGTAVRRTGGAAQGVLVAGTVMIRRVVRL
jgi:hypothetical protein